VERFGQQSRLKRITLLMVLREKSGVREVVVREVGVREGR